MYTKANIGNKHKTHRTASTLQSFSPQTLKTKSEDEMKSISVDQDHLTKNNEAQERRTQNLKIDYVSLRGHHIRF